MLSDYGKSYGKQSNILFHTLFEITMPINYRFRSFLEVCHIGVTMAVRVRLKFVALIHMVNTK
jgi:hypothetical protein